MFYRRLILVILCLSITLLSFGCIGRFSSSLVDGVRNSGRDPGVVIRDPGGQNNGSSQRQEDDTPPSPHRNGDTDSGSGEIPVNHKLDMSSSAAFIADVMYVYEITLLDKAGFLSGEDGDFLMGEICHALSLFSPEFIRALVAEYREHRANFIIKLDVPSRTEFGITEWQRNLTITLHYDKEPDENGITAGVLAHEMAHAVHFIIEEYIGEERSELELRAFNGDFDYVGRNYESVWNPDIHGFYFAYDYSMADYYEDFATIVEMLIADPEEMLARFNDAQHEALILKTIYLRDIIYSYLSDACSDVFTPLYDASLPGNLRAD